MEINKEKSTTEVLFALIYSKRKILIGLVVLATIISTIVSFLLTPYFKSTAIVFPAASGNIAFSEQRNAKYNSTDIGESEHAEQLIQVLESATVRDVIVKEFDLFTVYGIDKNKSTKNFELNKAYSNHVAFSRTRFGSVAIDVLDNDPKRASEIANRIVVLIDSVKNQMLRTRTLPALEMMKTSRAILMSDIDACQIAMDTLSKKGVVNVSMRGELYTALAQSTNETDRNFLRNLIEVNRVYGSAFDYHAILMIDKSEALSDFELAFKQSQADARSTITHKFVVENASPADKKFGPKRLFVVLFSVVSAFIFGIFVILIMDKFNRIKALSNAIN